MEISRKIRDKNGIICYDIEKLTGGKNYGNWEFTIKNQLMREGLWNAVIDRDGKIDPAIDQRALATIGLSVQPRIFNLLRTCKTAYEAWNTLKNACETKSFMQEVMLLRTLIKIRYDKCRNMTEYIDNILNVGQKLSAIDAEFPDRLIAIILLMNLPQSFDPLVVACTYRKNELTSEIVCAALLQEESRHELNATENQQERYRKEVPAQGASIRSPSYPYLSSDSNDETEKYTRFRDLPVKKKNRAVDESRRNNTGDIEIEKDTEENNISRISKKRKRESNSLYTFKPIQPIQSSLSQINNLNPIEEEKLIFLNQKIENLTMKVQEIVKLQTEGNDLLEKILLYQQEQTTRISIYEAKLQDLQDQGGQVEVKRELSETIESYDEHNIFIS